MSPEQVINGLLENKREHTNHAAIPTTPVADKLEIKDMPSAETCSTLIVFRNSMLDIGADLETEAILRPIRIVTATESMLDRFQKREDELTESEDDKEQREI